MNKIKGRHEGSFQQSIVEYPTKEDREGQSNTGERTVRSEPFSV